MSDADHRSTEGPEPAESLEPAQVAGFAERVLDEVARAVVGKREVLSLVLAGILAKGHVLLEDFPGLGKTLAARSFAGALGLEFSRAQFTPDLLPADLTGSYVYDQRRAEFDFRPGPVFAGLLLADEVNRTPPKTQAALLEAMQEGQVTVEGKTHPLPSPFHVLATANPVEYEGTYPLPEAQLDRFLLRVAFGYPTAGEEHDVLRRRLDRQREEVDIAQVTDAAGLAAAQAAVERVVVDESVARYCVDLVAATRSHPRRPHRRLAARQPRPGADRPGVGGDPRPRLRRPRGRQGRLPCRAGAPDHGQAGPLDDGGVRLAGRRLRADLGRDAAHAGGARGRPPVTSWRPTPALVRACLLGLGGVSLGIVLGQEVLAVLCAPFVVLAATGLASRPRRSPQVAAHLDHRRLHEGQGATSRLDVDDLAGVEHVTRVAARAAHVAASPDVRHGRLPRRRGTADHRIQPASLGSPRGGRRARRAHQPVGGLALGSGAAPRDQPGRAAQDGAVRHPGRGAAARRPRRPAPLAAGGQRHRVRGHPTLRHRRPPASGSTGRSRCAPASCTSSTTRAEQDAGVWLLVDALRDIGVSGGIDGRASTLDLTVRAAAALAEHHVRTGDRVGLLVVAANGARVPLGSGPRHLQRLLGTLARIRTDARSTPPERLDLGTRVRERGPRPVADAVHAAGHRDGQPPARRDVGRRRRHPRGTP